jgi:hypothetical protein
MTVAKLPADLPLAVAEGSDLAVALTVTEGGVAYDFTGAAITTVIYDDNGDVSAENFDTTTASNVLTISLSNLTTGDLGAGSFRYEVRVTKNSVTSPWVAGNLTVVPRGYGGSSSASATLAITTAPTVSLAITAGVGAWTNLWESIIFETTAGVAVDHGRLAWSDKYETLDIGLVNGGSALHVGQETLYYVKNGSGSTINKGQAVKFAGTEGTSQHLLIEPFVADGTDDSHVFMGLAKENIDNGEFGYVLNFGILAGLKTNYSGWIDGSLLWASPTAANGTHGLQITRPPSPNNNVLVAAVISAANNGAVFVRPTFSNELAGTEGVLISNPQDGDVLTYQASTGLWINQQPA